MSTNINLERHPQGGEEPSVDWRTHFLPESREKIVSKIIDTLKRHLPFSGQEGLYELKRIAVRFEEKIYVDATSQLDYLRKISLKMLTMETKSQNTMANPLQTNPADNSNRSPNPVVGRVDSMDIDNSRPPQDGQPSINGGDWRSQLQLDSRERIVNKIMDTLKRHLPFSGQEGLYELKRIAVRFEEKIFIAATSQGDYLRKISLKMLTMESNAVGRMPPSNLKRHRVLAFERD